MKYILFFISSCSLLMGCTRCDCDNEKIEKVLICINYRVNEILDEMNNPNINKIKKKDCESKLKAYYDVIDFIKYVNELYTVELID